MLPKKDFFSEVSVASLDNRTSVFDDENYDDEDDDSENQNTGEAGHAETQQWAGHAEMQQLSSSGFT